MDMARDVEFLLKVLPQGEKIWTLDPSEDALKNAKDVTGFSIGILVLVYY